jgi:hypothetical protein
MLGSCFVRNRLACGSRTIADHAARLSPSSQLGNTRSSHAAPQHACSQRWSRRHEAVLPCLLMGGCS